MDGSSWLLDHAEKVGIIGHLAFDVVALVQGWVVPRREHDPVVAERDALRTKLDEANMRDRAKLEQAEATLRDVLSPRRAT